MPNLPTGTVAFLFTDVEGNTQLWERNPLALKEAIAHHDALLRAAIDNNGGRVFKAIGDAFCATFATAPRALAAAAAGQQALLAAAWGDTGPLRVRMAIHVGAADDERENDYFGRSLNRVARLLAAGHGGQILVSQAAADLLRDAIADGTILRDLGERRLKDLARPEHVYQAVSIGLPTDFPTLRTLDSRPNNLPIQPTSFVGRQRELAVIGTLLDSTHLLTLTGLGGCGKTRLALHLASDRVDDFPDGVWLIELAPLADPDLVTRVTASTLGVRETADRPVLDGLVSILETRRLLIVLDNCEHVVAACALLADRILRSCPDVRILATSREALRTAGEVTWRVPSLGIDATPTQAAPDVAAVSEAIQLFVERASAVRPSFRLTSDNTATVAQICHQLDGIPLAIELAAARVNALAVDQILARLDRRFQLLTGGSRTALPRQQTLRATMNWSYNLLADLEKTLLRRLAVFSGGFGLDAAETVCAGGSLDTSDVLDLLVRLVDASLVVVRERDNGIRYDLLETVRQYGLERLTESGEAETLRERHYDWALALARAGDEGVQGPEQEYWLTTLRQETDNVRAAFDWSFESATREPALLCAYIYLCLGFLTSEPATDDWEARVLQRPIRDRWAGAKMELGKGVGCCWNGDWAEARARCETSLRTFRELGDSKWCGWALNTLGMIARGEGNSDEARARLEESIAAFRDAHDQFGIGMDLRDLGGLTLLDGDLARAEALFAESLTAIRPLGEHWNLAFTLNQLGLLCAQKGDKTRARELFEEAASHFERVHPARDVDTAVQLANLDRADGRFADARARLSRAAEHAQINGLQVVMGMALAPIGLLAFDEGDVMKGVQIAGCLRRHLPSSDLYSVDRSELETRCAEAQLVLGEDAYAVSWAEGQAMTLRDALAYGLREPDDPATRPNLNPREPVANTVHSLSGADINGRPGADDGRRGFDV